MENNRWFLRSTSEQENFELVFISKSQVFKDILFLGVVLPYPWANLL